MSIAIPLDDGKFHMVAVTYDWTSTGTSALNSWIRFYFDWEQIPRYNEGSHWSDVTFNTSQLNATIWWPWPWANYFKWEIDEVIVENIARSNEKMKKYYTYARWRFWIQ